METRPKVHFASIIILFGLAIGVALFVAAPYLFGRVTSNQTLRIIFYIFLSFPVPAFLSSYISGYRYGEEIKSKTLEDLLIIVICIAIVFMYAIIQASPGELGIVILKGLIFLVLLFGSVYGVSRVGYTFGISKSSG